MVSVRRVAPFLLLLILASTTLAQQQSSTPPRNLHRVGDHWTAWNPPDPSTYPPGAKTHVVKAGDTLWALAQQYFNSPYLWPQLWESNTWITDAHWIYPGDTLLVESEAIASSDVASSETLTAETPADTETAGPVASVTSDARPLALGTESDIYCYGYIGMPDEPMPNAIASFEEIDTHYVPRTDPRVPASAAAGDLIYVTGGANTGLVAGETYLAVEPGPLVYHPVTGETLGREYDYVGQVKILCTEDGQSRAIVTQSCREIPVGARLKPLPQLPIPIARIPDLPAWCDAPTGKTSGYIVDSKGWDLGAVEGNLVQINLGRADQLSPGDFLTVYRPSPIAGQPRQLLGEIGVLTTEASTATAIILKSRREILVGDEVEVR